MSLAYQVEPLSKELEAELSLMADSYWAEVAGPFHGFEPEVDWAAYENLAAQNRLAVVVGRDGAGEARAFSFATVGKHPHYRCRLGSITLLFVHPDYRKGREGLRLLNLITQAATDIGAQLVIGHGGVHNGVCRLFEYCKWADFGRYFVKVVAREG